MVVHNGKALVVLSKIAPHVARKNDWQLGVYFLKRSARLVKTFENCRAHQLVRLLGTVSLPELSLQT